MSCLVSAQSLDRVAVHSFPMTTSRTSRRAILGGALGTTLLGVGGGTAWALDRFVVDHAEITNASSYGQDASSSASSSASSTATASASESASTTSATSGTLTETSYTSDTEQITITSKSSGSGDSALAWFIADVQVTDATLVKTAFAEDTFGTNIIANPSDILSQFGGLFGINGDYYGFRETGIVIRNGVAFRDSGARQGLLLTRDGDMSLYDETATTAKQLVSDGAWQTWSFGPGLVTGGKVIDGIDSIEIDTNVGNHSIQGNQPRTAVGTLGTNHFVFVAVDGRSSGYSNGLTLPDLAELMKGIGCTVAYNLDGGGSTAMVFNGSLVNNPLGKGQERGTSDIIYLSK